MNRWFIALAVGLLLVGGCSSGSPYVSPEAVAMVDRSISEFRPDLERVRQFVPVICDLEGGNRQRYSVELVGGTDAVELVSEFRDHIVLEEGIEILVESPLQVLSSDSVLVTVSAYGASSILLYTEAGSCTSEPISREQVLVDP